MHCKIVYISFSVVVWLVLSPSIAQDITVKVNRILGQPSLCPCSTNPNDPPPYCTETYTYASGSDITIDVATCIDSINIYGGASVDVGLVTINGSGIGLTNRLEIILGASSWSGGGYDGPGRQSVAALRDFGGIVFNNSITRNNTIIAGRVAGNLTGDIDVGQVSRLDIDGQVDAAIVVGAPSSTSFLMIIEASSITSNGNVELEAGNITRVKVYGDIAAPSSGDYSISANNGRVILVETDDLNSMTATADLLGGVQSVAERIEVLDIDGNIGSPTITTKISARNFIQSVEAGAVWADFEVALETPGASEGNFWSMTTTTGGFQGSIKAGRLNGSPTVNTFNIAGDWDADVTLYRDIVTPVNIDGDFSSGTVWTIGREIRTGLQHARRRLQGR